MFSRSTIHVKINIQEKLDRDFCNQHWLFNFSEALVHNLPRTRSDHLPLLVAPRQVIGSRTREKPFKLLTSWMDHSLFSKLVVNCWTKWKGGILCNDWISLKLRRGDGIGLFSVISLKEKIDVELDCGGPKTVMC